MRYLRISHESTTMNFLHAYCINENADAILNDFVEKIWMTTYAGHAFIGGRNQFASNQQQAYRMPILSYAAILLNRLIHISFFPM